MKGGVFIKTIKILLLIIAVLLLIPACSKEEAKKADTVQSTVHEDTNGNDTVAETEDAQENTETTVIKKSVIPEEVLNRPIIDEYSVDIDDDGTEERVVLGGNLWIGPDGEYEYNDGQMWSLYVVDGTEGYLIFDQYINIGRPFYQVCTYTTEKGNEKQINAIIEDSAGFYVDGYRYSAEKGGFVEKRLYDSENESDAGISIEHSSISSYSPNL